MMHAYTFHVAPRPAWSITCTTHPRDDAHAVLVEDWWASGFTLMNGELAKVECVRVGSRATHGSWKWHLVPVEHEGQA
jgi:hypothetical protein